MNKLILAAVVFLIVFLLYIKTNTSFGASSKTGNELVELENGPKLEQYNNKVIIGKADNHYFNSTRSDRAYLTSPIENNLTEGTVLRRFTENDVIIHVQANLPDTQAIFEYTSKDKCDCYCNGNFDCECGIGRKNCPYYMAWIISESTGHRLPIGKMVRFRDGVYRSERAFPKNVSLQINDHGIVVVTFEGNLNKDHVLKTSFNVLVGHFNTFRY